MSTWSTEEPFLRLIAGKQFPSVVEFEAALSEFMAQSYTYFVRRSSAPAKKHKIRYEQMFYLCDHYPRRKSVSRGLRKINHKPMHCEARFTMRRSQDKLVKPVNQRLTAEEMEELRPIVRISTNKQLKQYIAERFSKSFSTQTVVYLRSRLLNETGPQRVCVTKLNKTRIRRSICLAKNGSRNLKLIFKCLSFLSTNELHEPAPSFGQYPNTIDANIKPISSDITERDGLCLREILQTERCDQIDCPDKVIPF
ncbi:hypothetical protein EG68_05772 [Paragonimus skrjabini miyazakii]|uniref:Uncharacterized protein n=1 Tax=Paragonimus skrjabini miyazakii TaxID=59628 RepID=A0A8S9YQ78_9TREM|nr:hypothetical protein EG68_05772 [Paragonimus skrjabini miyazakii]